MSDFFNAISNLTGAEAKAYGDRQAKISMSFNGNPEAREARFACQALGVSVAFLEILLVNTIAHLETIEPWAKASRELEKAAPQHVKHLEAFRAYWRYLGETGKATIEREVSNHPHLFDNKTTTIAESVAAQLTNILGSYEVYSDDLNDTWLQLGLPSERLGKDAVAHAVIGRFAATLMVFFRDRKEHSDIVAVLAGTVLHRICDADEIDRWRENFINRRAARTEK